MSDHLLPKSYRQLESMEKTLQRTRSLQSKGLETLRGLPTTEQATAERQRRFRSSARIEADRQCSERGRALFAAWQTMRSSLHGPSKRPETYTEYDPPVHVTFPPDPPSRPSSQGSEESVNTVIHAPVSVAPTVMPDRPSSQCSERTSDVEPQPEKSIYITGSVMRADDPPVHSGPAPPAGTEALELIYYSKKGYSQTWIAWKDDTGEFVETRYPDFSSVL